VINQKTTKKAHIIVEQIIPWLILLGLVAVVVIILTGMLF
jgi:hypothetical protein